jgi:hypothetical protein
MALPQSHPKPRACFYRPSAGQQNDHSALRRRPVLHTTSASIGGYLRPACRPAATFRVGSRLAGTFARPRTALVRGVRTQCRLRVTEQAHRNRVYLVTAVLPTHLSAPFEDPSRTATKRVGSGPASTSERLLDPARPRTARPGRRTEMIKRLAGAVTAAIPCVPPAAAPSQASPRLNQRKIMTPSITKVEIR